MPLSDDGGILYIPFSASQYDAASQDPAFLSAIRRASPQHDAAGQFPAFLSAILRAASYANSDRSHSSSFMVTCQQQELPFIRSAA